ncbi:MAG: hypothetical protein EA401_03255 [Planctomycetota bacterium]|nr:MAG: hypothetical protein EA401_03255 [Planctomycetota bacterium]
MIRLLYPLMACLVLVSGLPSEEDNQREMTEVIEAGEVIDIAEAMEMGAVILDMEGHDLQDIDVDKAREAIEAHIRWQAEMLDAIEMGAEIIDLEVDVVEIRADEAAQQLTPSSSRGTSTAQEQPSQIVVSHLEWDQDTISTSQAQAWLSEHDQPTHIVGMSDEERPFSFTSGSYWQAIIALSETFNLSIDPPAMHARINHAQRRHHNGTAYAPMGGGRVTLRPRPEDLDAEERWHQPERAHALHMQSSGIFLVEIIDAGIFTSSDSDTYQASIAYRVRCEPGQDLERFSAATIHWEGVFSGNRQRLEWPEDQRGDFRHRMHGSIRSNTHNRPPQINMLSAEGRDSTPTRLLAEGSVSANRLSTKEYHLELEADSKDTITVNGQQWQVINSQGGDNEEIKEAIGRQADSPWLVVIADPAAADDMSGLRVLAQDNDGNSLLSGSTGTSRSNQRVKHRVGLRDHQGTISVTLQVTSMQEDTPAPFSLVIDLTR